MPDGDEIYENIILYVMLIVRYESKLNANQTGWG